MSIDQQLLRAVRHDLAFLRLYRWNPGCLSFGRNEPASTLYDRDEIDRLGLDTVRRPTGGGAVWHESELTYAVAVPLGTFGSLRETYLAIHRLLAAALARLGVRGSLAQPGSRLARSRPGSACFAAPAGGEVVVGDRKLVGSAQMRERTACMQHGSILLEQGQDMIARVARGPMEPIHATSLTDVLQRRVDHEEVAEVIVREAQEQWVGTWVMPDRSPGAAVGDKFGEAAWTWRL